MRTPARPDLGQTVVRTPVFARLFLLLALWCALAAPAVPQARPAVNARAAIVVNMDTGKVLFAKNPDLSIPPASLTKVMTMFLTMDMVRKKKSGWRTR